jgi:hypothetical protein
MIKPKPLFYRFSWGRSVIRRCARHDMHDVKTSRNEYDVNVDSMVVDDM